MRRKMSIFWSNVTKLDAVLSLLSFFTSTVPSMINHKYIWIIYIFIAVLLIICLIEFNITIRYTIKINNFILENRKRYKDELHSSFYSELKEKEWMFVKLADKYPYFRTKALKKVIDDTYKSFHD